MPPGERDQLLALLDRRHPTQRIVQRRHAVHGAYRTAAAQLVERRQVRSVVTGRDGHHFQMQRFGQHLEAGIGQRIGGNDVAGFEQGHQRHRQPLLGSVDDQHLPGIGLHPRSCRCRATEARSCCRPAWG